MRRKAQAFFTLFYFSTIGLVAEPKASQGFESFNIIERISFETFTTSEGNELILYIGESTEGRNPSLSVVYSIGLESPLNEVIEIDHGHSPLIEKKENLILILFTAGANTTCVAKIEIKEGIPKHVSTETIAWNDSGVYRKSESFPTYEHLIEKRRHNQAR